MQCSAQTMLMIQQDRAFPSWPGGSARFRGPLGSSISQLGVQITDSPYVTVSMRIMTRMGTPALQAIEETGSFVRAVHSVGAPLKPGQGDVPWPCNQLKCAALVFGTSTKKEQGPAEPGLPID
jgi:hypothetical protein